MVTKISKWSRIQDSCQIMPKIESLVVYAMPDIPSKFPKDPSITFQVIAWTHRQTNKQTNKNRQKHCLFGGGKKVELIKAMLWLSTIFCKIYDRCQCSGWHSSSRVKLSDISRTLCSTFYNVLTAQNNTYYQNITANATEMALFLAHIKLTKTAFSDEMCNIGIFFDISRLFRIVRQKSSKTLMTKNNTKNTCWINSSV